jgi:putative membrane protein
VDAALLTAWQLDPSVLAGLAALTLAYVAVRRLAPVDPSQNWQLAAFGLTLLTLVVALVSPLDAVADRALFSAHMLQHLLLLLVVPTLALISLPEAALASLGQKLAATPILGQLGRPGPALALSLATIWLWHAPRLYEAALQSETLHAGEHLCFLLTATLYWWPIVRPSTYPGRPPEPVWIASLFAAAIGSSLLAALISFSPDVLYATYAQPRAFPVLRAALGLSPRLDQQVGGLLMWGIGGVWYVLAAGVVFFRWLGPEESKEWTGAP